MKNIKDMVVDLIVENDLQDSFFKILKDIIKGKMNRDIDELYNGGFWDFTYDLGFNCDTRENEKMFESIYNQLWEIAEKVFGE
jgi:hypothetical protein